MSGDIGYHYCRICGFGYQPCMHLRSTASPPDDGPSYATNSVQLLDTSQLRKDAAIGRLIRRRLVSGNGIPVSRAYVTAAEVHDIDAEGGK